ncbi:hypothetical protein ACI2L1_09395 [Streptomyces sp. NPDC019531]|uniref:hypothetical protein n=1 Tax=Streptomyces sp. NPDC019531 TaxID=3365062 RepID=UPI00384A8DA6
MCDGRFPGAPPSGHVHEKLQQTSLRTCPSGHRQICGGKELLPLLRIVGFLIAAVATVIAAMASVFSGIVAYDPLREVVVTVSAQCFGANSWWPLLVYGPWMVASLSILQSALHRQRAAHSWCVVLFFSAVAVALCIDRVPRTLPGISAAALPAIGAMTGFQQLVRQIALARRPPCDAVLRYHDTFCSSR